MKRFLVLGLVVSLTAVAAGRGDEPDPEPVGKDRAVLMRGSWELISLSIGGMKIEVSKLGGAGKMMVMKFEKGSVMTMTGNGMTKKGTWKIDPNKKPRTIDLTSKEDNKTTLGIYKVDKNELVIVFGQPGQARPTDFAGKNAMTPIVYLKQVVKKK